MLAIRMQRTGRKGHAMFRVIVQESRLAPTSGKVVVQLGSYDPHAKTVTLNKEKASFYLEHGAQPSDRVARLLKSEGVKLPSWVKLPAEKTGAVRNADKRRSTRPPEEQTEAPAEDTPPEEVPQPAEADATTEAPVAEESTETEAPVEETAAEEVAEAPEEKAEQPAPETEAPADAEPEVEKEA